LPPVSGLDAIKGAASAAQSIPVLPPFLEENTTPGTGAQTLDFAAPPASIAWAIYRVHPSSAILYSAVAQGSGGLWMLVADYAADRWALATPFSPSSATIDLSLPGNIFSPAGYVYLAFVAPPDQSGRLEQLDVVYEGNDDYALTAESVGGAITPFGIHLTWTSGIADSFRIYRSTQPGDPTPYMIHAYTDNYPAQNEYVEFFSTMAPPDNKWVAFEYDGETPGDPSDDYPFIAPGVPYYYRLVPVIGGVDQPATPEVGIKLPWGTRRSTRRPLPLTTSQTCVFADQLDPASMTPEQIQWCATNLVGTQKITQTSADTFRADNPDFLVLGYHLAAGAGDIGNVVGDAWIPDADWAYVNNHETWFLHMPTSPQPNGRVLQQDWNWYVADPASFWQDYLSASLLEVLGEDHFDGWFVDSCSEPWNTDPAQWWPDGDTMFGYWTPRLNSLLMTINALAKAHPLQPYIIPNAGAYVTTLSDIKYYGANWACDGIMIEGHGHWSPGDYFDEADWQLQHNRILDHQAHGLATILQTNIYTPDTQDRLFVYASYLLVRGDNTYINWLGDDGLDSILAEIGQWYPEFDTDADLGPPVGAPPATMEAMLSGGLYRRNFGSGFVLVNPSDQPVQFTFPYLLEKLTVSGGGNISATGVKQGSCAWEVINTPQTVPADSALIIRDILD
jgi:hypothetical protein